MAAAKPAATASCPMPRCVVPRTRPARNSSWVRCSNSRHSSIVRYIRRRSWRSTVPAAVASVTSVLIGDEQLLRREAGDDLRLAGGDDDLLLDARRRVAVCGGAVGLERDDHALLELDRVVERVEAADDRPLVEEEPHAVAELEPEALHLRVEAELLGLRPDRCDLVGRDARLHQLDRRIDPFPRALVRVALRVGRGADGEGAVVAGLVADEGLDDVEEGLVAGADEAVAGNVRMRGAAL